jgi:hypothetical protein
MKGPGRLPALVLLLPLLPFPASTLEVYVAALAVVDDTGSAALAVSRPQSDLWRELTREQTGDSLAFLRPDAEHIPASLLEASLLCERLGCAYLLYGYVKRTSVAFSAELKLLDHERGRLAAVFFGSDDPDHYDRLVRDMAAKVREYFFAEAGLRPPRPAEPPRRNLWEFSGWLGYWTPMGGEWDRVIAGIATAGLAARLIPAYPLFVLRSRSAYLSLGLEGEYGLGMNEPGYESSFLHVAKLRFVLEAVLELPAGHAAGLAAGTLVELDTAVQDRKYASPLTDSTVAPGLCLAFLYRYRLSKRLALGAASIVDFTAYSPALVVFSPRLFVSFRKGATDE